MQATQKQLQEISEAIQKIAERQTLMETSFKELLNALNNRYASSTSQSTICEESLPPRTKRPRQQSSDCKKQSIKYSEDMWFAEDAWHG